MAFIIINPHSNSRAVVFSDWQLAKLKNGNGILESISAIAVRILSRQIAGRPSLATHPQAQLLRPAVGLAVMAIAISLLLFAVGDISNDETMQREQSAATQSEAAAINTPTDFGQGELANNLHKKGGIDTPPSGNSTITQLDGTGSSTTQLFAGSHSVQYLAEATPSDKQSPNPVAQQKLSTSEQRSAETMGQKPAPSEQQLPNQSPSAFTIQLLASYNRAALSHYAHDNKVESQTSIYEGKRDKRHWFVLTYGSYANAQEARAAISTLPDKLQRNTPWVRPLKSIYQAK